MSITPQHMMKTKYTSVHYTTTYDEY